MKLRKLRGQFDKIRNNDPSFDEEMDFINSLIEHHDQEALEFHFDLLRNRDDVALYYSIRAAFEKHGPAAEPFLAERFRAEQDPRLRGDALQILGHMRSKSARILAKEVGAEDHEDLRYRAVIVLGWVGTMRDMKTVLRDRLLNDASPFIRGNAATAFRQVWYRSSRAKDPAIEILGEALALEEDEEAVAGIVVSLQTIMKRRFGLREPDDGPDYVGDVVKAKERASRSVKRALAGGSSER